ncbi:MAG: P-loop NTPase [Rhodospirillaceae bacterium]|nr:P-loop NTPase [Rhodospirillaceae bacterium]
MSAPLRPSPGRRPRCLVLGNEKGGSGKSTTALHLAVAALHGGARVGLLDLDVDQGTAARFYENRVAHAGTAAEAVPMPVWLDGVAPGAGPDALAEVLGRTDLDLIVIDTPGSPSALGRTAHSFADVLVTPINDSFVDLDLIARAVPDDGRPPPLGPYAAMVFDQRKRRMARDGRSIDWVVLRNRLSNLDARNKREVADALAKLSRRIGFRTAPGFGERVVFRELFRQGLTVLDLPPDGLTMSQVAARQELRSLVAALGPVLVADAAGTSR